MEQVAMLLAAAFAANKIVTVLKGLASRDWNLAVTQILVWIVAFGFLALLSEAEVSEGLILPGMSAPLGELDIASLLLLGLIAGSTGSVVFDFKKAIDSTDSASEPRLLR